MFSQKYSKAIDATIAALSADETADLCEYGTHSATYAAMTQSGDLFWAQAVILTLRAHRPVPDAAQLARQARQLLTEHGLDPDAVVRVMAPRTLGIAVCRQCGCTDLTACDEGCYWVAADLCSACVGPDDHPDS